MTLAICVPTHNPASPEARCNRLKPESRSIRDKFHSGASLLVKKAVITAAAQSQRTLPLQSLIDG
ncbi:MAG: hypothetical protein WA354_12305, partial [Terracidiphilus sp.]